MLLTIFITRWAFGATRVRNRFNQAQEALFVAVDS
jgi:hypothetical protein